VGGGGRYLPAEDIERRFFAFPGAVMPKRKAPSHKRTHAGQWRQKAVDPPATRAPGRVHASARCALIAKGETIQRPLDEPLRATRLVYPERVGRSKMEAVLAEDSTLVHQSSARPVPWALTPAGMTAGVRCRSHGNPHHVRRLTFSAAKSDGSTASGAGLLSVLGPDKINSELA